MDVALPISSARVGQPIAATCWLQVEATNDAGQIASARCLRLASPDRAYSQHDLQLARCRWWWSDGDYEALPVR